MIGLHTLPQYIGNTSNQFDGIEKYTNVVTLVYLNCHKLSYILLILTELCIL